MKKKRICLRAKGTLAAISLCLVLGSSFAAGPITARQHFAAPETLSAEMSQTVAAPPPSLWVNAAKDNAEVSQIAKKYADAAGPAALAMARAYGVGVKQATLAGIPVFELTPPKADPEKSGKVVFYIHGGGYILGHGVSGIVEAIPLAGWTNYRVICVDYRMAPEHPFPAAIDDAFIAYRALVKQVGAQNIAVFGTSTGGAMTLVLALQAIEAKAPLPAALIAGTPWSDMSKIGDTYRTNAGVDNVLHSYEGLLQSAVRAYAGKNDLKNPLISPVYARSEDLKTFPPTLLVSGTRDLFLSNTVRMHKRLLLEKVPAELIVYEALSHAQYYLNPKAPETKEHYMLLDRFLERRLLKSP